MTIREKTLAQLKAAGIVCRFYLPRPGEDCVRGELDAARVIPMLLLDAARPDPDAKWQFQIIRSIFHADIGPARIEFRTYTGAFGQGSMQIVINPVTGEFFADVDRWNPGQDVVNFLGHEIWEVLVKGYGRKAWAWLTRRF